MYKSLLYAVNTATQSVVALGTNVNYGAPVRKVGCNINLYSTNISTKGIGDYEYISNITFNATADGAVTVQMYKDGVAISGATSVLTVATGDTYNIITPFNTYNECCKSGIITCVVSGVTGSITNATIEVKKL